MQVLLKSPHIPWRNKSSPNGARVVIETVAILGTIFIARLHRHWNDQITAATWC